MPEYSNNNVPSVTQLHDVIVLIKTLLQTLESRVDIQVTATTEADADYAAELVDGRVDTWANEHASIGTNIRDGQLRLLLCVNQVRESHQGQIDNLSEAILEYVAGLAEGLSTHREEISYEEERRIENERNLQNQIDKVSKAILIIVSSISEMRERARQKEEE